MVQVPEVQHKAHDELDRVIGRERMPDLADRESLPYIQAICKESHRWQPVLPLGLAHTSIEDDVFNGYHIPKGTVIAPNAW